jgi:hypothetical protein
MLNRIKVLNRQVLRRMPLFSLSVLAFFMVFLALGQKARADICLVEEQQDLAICVQNYNECRAICNGNYACIDKCATKYAACEDVAWGLYRCCVNPNNGCPN